MLVHARRVGGGGGGGNFPPLPAFGGVCSRDCTHLLSGQELRLEHCVSLVGRARSRPGGNPTRAPPPHEGEPGVLGQQTVSRDCTRVCSSPPCSL